MSVTVGRTSLKFTPRFTPPPDRNQARQGRFQNIFQSVHKTRAQDPISEMRAGGVRRGKSDKLDLDHNQAAGG
jgi:hypothetical protein